MGKAPKSIFISNANIVVRLQSLRSGLSGGLTDRGLLSLGSFVKTSFPANMASTGIIFQRFRMGLYTYRQNNYQRTRRYPGTSPDRIVVAALSVPVSIIIFLMKGSALLIERQK